MTTAPSPDLQGIDTMYIGEVLGVGCTYTLLYAPDRAPRYLVRCEPSGPARLVSWTIVHEADTLTAALLWAGEAVTAEVDAEMAT